MTNKDKETADYFILVLDMKIRRIKVYRFSKLQLDIATAQYNSMEEEFATDKSKDLVLVSAQSIKDLKRAYPNYFSDTTEFSQNLKRVYKKNLDNRKKLPAKMKP
jgi:maltoporin